MKHLTILITSLLFISPLFAYDLTSSDRLLIDSFQPKIEQMLEQETEKFESVLTKLETMLPIFDASTRVYVVLEYLQQVMISLIPEEPTVIETLDLQGLMDQIIFVESVAQVPMNNIEEAPIQENKQPAQGQLDEMTKHDTDQLEEGIEEEIEEDFDLGQGFTAEWEPEDEKNIDEANSEPTDYYAQEVGDYEDAETDDEIPADLDVYDNDLDEDFILSDQGFEFDYEIDEDEEFPIE